MGHQFKDERRNLSFGWGLAFVVVCLFYALQAYLYIVLRFLAGKAPFLPDLFLWVFAGYLSLFGILLGAHRTAEVTPNRVAAGRNEPPRPAETVQWVGWFLLVKIGIAVLGMGISRVLPEHSTLWGDSLLTSGWVTVGCLGPMLEETFFRWFLMERLLDTHSDRKCILFSSFTFALGHDSVQGIVLSFLFGLFLSWVYVRTRQIIFPIAFHSVNNLLSLALLNW